ncbi:MAG: N-acetyltransferase [Deltaproteobacteria bacterium]|nr:MAG: N-acetyltransferase [Deltaproteobacteria bacterium]
MLRGTTATRPATVRRYSANPALETDLMIIALDGRVVRRDGYWVGRRPRHPDHIWGNLLVLDAPPERGGAAAERWIARFAEEMGPGTRHVALGWDGELDRGDTLAFVSRRFDPIEVVALSTTAPVVPEGAADVVVRPLKSNAEWRACFALTRQMEDDPRPDAAFEAWLARQLRQHRHLMGRGHGAYFGAFDGDRLIASLGIYVRAEDGLARYQLVVTDRRYRGRGVARRLVGTAGLYAVSELGARELVIAAERGGSAERVYRAAGFTTATPHAGVMRRRKLTRPPVA